MLQSTLFIALGLAGWLACGDPGSPLPNPDDELGCHVELAPSATAYRSAADFGAAEPNSLHGWEPNGSWFIRGLGPNAAAILRFTRFPASPAGVFSFGATLGDYDQSVAFVQYQNDDGRAHHAIRISNRRSDGTLRYDSASCTGNDCRVCRGRLHTATWMPNESESHNLVKVGELAEPLQGAQNVRLLGNYAYVANGFGIRIVDVQDPSHPVTVGTWNAGGSVNDLRLVQAASRVFALVPFTPSRIVDVTDPAHAFTVSEIPESAYGVGIETRGKRSYAWWGERNGACPLYDVTDPLRPQLLSRFQTAASAVDAITVKDGVAYLNAWDGGLYRVDYANPAAPVVTGQWQSTISRSHASALTVAGGRKVVLHGDEGLGARLAIVDAEPASPTYMQEIGSYQTRSETSISNVTAIGDRAYVAYYHDGVRVLDLADPTAPKLLGYFNTWDTDDIATGQWLFESARGIDVDPARRLIFVADTQRGLIILQDQTPL